MCPIRCEIVTQERVIFDEVVDMVVAPGSEGELGVLPRHVPLLTALTAGELKVRIGDREEPFAIGGGFMEIQPDKVTVLASSAEHADGIDLARAEEARARAKALLKDGPPPDPTQFRQIEAALRRSQVRLKVARKRRQMQRPGTMLDAGQ